MVEVYCWRDGASAGPVADETFDDVDEGDAVLQFKQERNDVGFLNNGRVIVRGPKESRFRVEVVAHYRWHDGAQVLTDEELEQHLWQEGASVLVPYLREAVSTCAGRLGLQVQLPLVALPTESVSASLK